MANYANLLFFLILSGALLWFTLRRPYAHRGYRFAAFECVLVLVFLQADVWFKNPGHAWQILSWIFLGGSLGLAVYGFGMLRRKGAPDQDLENTTVLVTDGAYRFIRHPLYASLLLAGVGAALKSVSILVLIVLALLLIMVYATARVEERGNIARFGDDYVDYMSHTKMFIPHIF